MKQKPQEFKKIDALFNEFSDFHKNEENIKISAVFSFLLIFGLIGLITAVPFPKLAFLGKYYIFINWFSFVLAFSIFYYSLISPLLSYIMLFVFGIMYFFIVQLEYVEQGGGPKLWQVSLLITVISLIAHYIGYKKEGKSPSFYQNVKFIIISPIWYIHLILKKKNIKY